MQGRVAATLFLEYQILTIIMHRFADLVEGKYFGFRVKRNERVLVQVSHVYLYIDRKSMQLLNEPNYSKDRRGTT